MRDQNRRTAADAKSPVILHTHQELSAVLEQAGGDAYYLELQLHPGLVLRGFAHNGARHFAMPYGAEEILWLYDLSVSPSQCAIRRRYIRGIKETRWAPGSQQHGLQERGLWGPRVQVSDDGQHWEDVLR